MSDKFLTLTEAQQFTQKSRSTLRRFVEGIVKTDDHADRKDVLPTVDEVRDLKENNQPFSWRISESLLSKEFNQADSAATANDESRGVVHDDRLVAVLEKTVVVLQEELNEKNRQIAAFQERQREQNHLLKSLHDQLALAAPASSNQAGDTVIDSVDAEDGPQKQPEEGSDTPARKRFWQREFHLFGRR